MVPVGGPYKPIQECSASEGPTRLVTTEELAKMNSLPVRLSGKKRKSADTEEPPQKKTTPPPPLSSSSSESWTESEPMSWSSPSTSSHYSPCPPASPAEEEPSFPSSPPRVSTPLSDTEIDPDFQQWRISAANFRELHKGQHWSFCHDYSCLYHGNMLSFKNIWKESCGYCGASGHGTTSCDLKSREHEHGFTAYSAPIRCLICESSNHIAYKCKVTPTEEQEYWRDEYTKAADAGVEEVEKLKTSVFIEAGPPADEDSGVERWMEKNGIMDSYRACMNVCPVWEICIMAGSH